eukprot:m.115654 g.115654  ORF g.115654 m.115654 type:complete len:627 (+) comp9170_c1_seq3:2651-4531(+)
MPTVQLSQLDDRLSKALTRASDLSRLAASYTILDGETSFFPSLIEQLDIFRREIETAREKLSNGTRGQDEINLANFLSSFDEELMNFVPTWLDSKHGEFFHLKALVDTFKANNFQLASHHDVSRLALCSRYMAVLNIQLPTQPPAKSLPFLNALAAWNASRASGAESAFAGRNWVCVPGSDMWVAMNEFLDFAKANSANSALTLLVTLTDVSALADSSTLSVATRLYVHGRAQVFTPPSRPCVNHVDDVTAETATLCWQPSRAGAEHVTAYQVIYGPAAGPAASGGSITVPALGLGAEVKTTLTGLTGGTHYEVFVQPVLFSDPSLFGAASTTKTFATQVQWAPASALVDYVIGTASEPHRCMIEQSADPLNRNGWTHLFGFRAFSTPQPGTVRFIVGEAFEPHRIMLTQSEVSHFNYAGMQHRLVFYAFPCPVPGGCRIAVGETHGPYRAMMHIQDAGDMMTSEWTPRTIFYAYPSGTVILHPPSAVVPLPDPARSVPFVVGTASNPLRSMLAQTDRPMSEIGWTHSFGFRAFAAPQPGTVRFTVGVAQDPHRIMVLRADDVQYSFCGWRPLFAFHAFPAPAPGLIRVAVGDAYEPHRVLIQLAGVDDIASDGWSPRLVFYALPS